jgi:hypothetical protein
LVEEWLHDACCHSHSGIRPVEVDSHFEVDYQSDEEEKDEAAATSAAGSHLSLPLES